MKRVMLCLALLLGCMAFSWGGMAEAAKWVWVKSTDTTTVEVDADSIRKTDGGVAYWARFSHIESPLLEKKRHRMQAWSDKYRKGIDYSTYYRTLDHLYVYEDASGSLLYKRTAMAEYNTSEICIYEHTWPLAKAKVFSIMPGTFGEDIYHKVQELLQAKKDEA